ncbi:MAG: hypothetical protein SFZ02_09685 [bacterium]|nr:hypothetical protein [bacterium]
MPYDIHLKFLLLGLDRKTAIIIYNTWRKIQNPDRQGLEMSKNIRGEYTLWRDRVFVDEVTIEVDKKVVGYRVIVDKNDRILAMFRKDDDPDYTKISANLAILQEMAKDIW